MENEPKEVYLVTHDLDETDQDYLPTDNDFDTIEGEYILWCPNEVDGMNNIKYIHHSEVDRLIQDAIDKALEVAQLYIKKSYKDKGLTNTGESIANSILSLKPEILKQLNK